MKHFQDHIDRFRDWADVRASAWALRCLYAYMVVMCAHIGIYWLLQIPESSMLWPVWYMMEHWRWLIAGAAILLWYVILHLIEQRIIYD